MANKLKFPDDKKFAFTIIDDTDVATRANVEPVYRLLEDLGLRTTKTVWPMDCPEGSRNFSSSETLEDPAYREFIVDLQRRGFEIASHGATMESSTRERTLAAFDRFKETFGTYPRVHANHAFNRENIYWGGARVDHPPISILYQRFNRRPHDFYLGHVEGSDYWWGDFCAQHIAYVRNLTFQEINLAKVNPSMPYHDPSRPLVRWWFSASDAENCQEFNELLRPENQERLEDEGGFCIVATHLGKGFVADGSMNPQTRRSLETLAQRPGWFPTVGELLDWLRAQHGGDTIPRREWRKMQWRWTRDLIWRKLSQRRQRRRKPPRS